MNVLVQLDGETEPTPLDDLSWETVAPCGCTCAAAVARYYGTDVEKVRKRLVPHAEERRREDAQGFVYRLDRTEAVCDRLTVDCPHTPKWGVEKAPVPSGYWWAHASGGRRAHLVAVPAAADKVRFEEWAVPLCGGKRDLFGKNWDDYPTCRTCEKKAREMGGAS